MKKVKKMKAFSYAEFQMIVMAFAGIVGGMLYAFIGAMYDASTGNIGYGTALAFLAIPIMPIYFAVFGFVTGVIGAFLYNQFATFIRLKEMDFEK